MAGVIKLESDPRITVLALSWRDIKAPKAGGAEIHTHEMLSRADHKKIRFIHFSPLFDSASPDETIDGVRYLRQGNIFSVISAAHAFYRANRDRIDFVIDQCNTHRFFTPFWVPQEKRIFYIHQLTREIWDIQTTFPVSTLGKHLETPMLRMNRNDRAIITVSESTKKDLVAVGFPAERITIVPNALSRDTRACAQNIPEKVTPATFIYVGRFAHYKGIDAAIEALGIVKKTYPDARLWCVGKKDDTYIANTLHPICERYGLTEGAPESNADVIYWGFVSDAQKMQLQGQAKALLFPSVREGWGIIVLEAGIMNTPSIVYDAPGCRDAVDNGKTGYLCRENTPQELARLMSQILDNPSEYASMQKVARDFSKQFSWDKSAKIFTDLILNLGKGSV